LKSFVERSTLVAGEIRSWSPSFHRREAGSVTFLGREGASGALRNPWATCFGSGTARPCRPRRAKTWCPLANSFTWNRTAPPVRIPSRRLASRRFPLASVRNRPQRPVLSGSAQVARHSLRTHGLQVHGRTRPGDDFEPSPDPARPAVSSDDPRPLRP